VNLLELAALLFGVAAAAGVLGSLLGLGGGFVLVPVLTLGLHLDIRLAIGTSIVAVCATSAAGAGRNVGESMTNLRVAMFLAVATTIGAVSGAWLALVVSGRFLYLLFGAVLLFSAVQVLLRRPARDPVATVVESAEPADPTVPAAPEPEPVAAGVASHTLATRLALHSAYYDHVEEREVEYTVRHSKVGFGLMYVAGVISGLLGIGSGALRVPAMDLAMRLPMKVSTATSNLLIGLTASASALVYFARGDVDPYVAGPVAAGIMLGAVVGARMLSKVRADRLRVMFVLIIGVVAAQMLWKGFH
jgi:uncharacterized membrane protein YfcA